MKLRTVNIIELILGIIFMVGCFFRGQLPYLGMVYFLTGFVLSLFYFPAGFYTLAAQGIRVVNSAIYGVAFSVAVIGIMFGLNKFPLAEFYLLFGLTLFALLPIVKLISINFKRTLLLQFNKAILLRYVVLLGILLYAFLTL